LIFLTVGSWHKGFDRLVRAVEKLRRDNVISEEVVAQIGPGQYKPQTLRTMEFCSPRDFQQFIAEARVIIAHAGMGTIAEALSRSKPIIVVPRKASLNEANTDHQFTTARTLEAEGKILVAYDTEDLAGMVDRAGNFAPSGSSLSNDLCGEVKAFIENARKKLHLTS